MTGAEGHPNAYSIEKRKGLCWNKDIVLFRYWFDTENPLKCGSAEMCKVFDN